MDPAEIEARIARDYAREIRACEALVDAYLVRCEPTWTGRSANQGADSLLVPEMARQTKTFRGSVELARRGYGEQANMLNRALFESMGVVRWIIANEEEALRRFGRSRRWEVHQTIQRLKNARLSEQADDLESDLTPEEIKELTTEFGAYNEKMWTGCGNIIQLFESVKDQFDEGSWAVVDNFRRLAHTENNSQLHSSVAGLDQTLLKVNPSVYGVWTGPSDGMIQKALFGAWFSFHQALEVFAEHFELHDLAGLKERTAATGYAFHRSPPAGETPGRNDPCWCGSGRKFKKCHGT